MYLSPYWFLGQLITSRRMHWPELFDPARPAGHPAREHVLFLSDVYMSANTERRPHRQCFIHPIYGGNYVIDISVATNF